MDGTAMLERCRNTWKMAHKKSCAREAEARHIRRDPKRRSTFQLTITLSQVEDGGVGNMTGINYSILDLEEKETQQPV